MRYYVIDMAARMDIEIGWPVAAPVASEGRVAAGVLPAGRYASLVYTGVQNGVARQQGADRLGRLKTASAGIRWDDPNGDAFRARRNVL